MQHTLMCPPQRLSLTDERRARAMHTAMRPAWRTPCPAGSLAADRGRRLNSLFNLVSKPLQPRPAMSASTAIRPKMMSQSRFRDPHQDRPFTCPVPLCGGRFHRKFTLHEHMKTHTGEHPHQCPIRSCGKRFSTSGNLARHKRLHSLHKIVS
ncbi:hypothetical protein PF010_g30167 [Phytophthora fragariae]|uniref:C2H2-type domain-containing protein n=1 Tax=Phytophthora fragariae TaxID=53985 RepID=A0A6G0JL08_9STRA|nr:hypothetical protein PF010_g30167 [Phytophthora fragariae]